MAADSDPPGSYVSDAMRGAVGGIVDHRISYPVSASDIRKWAIAVYWPEPVPASYLAESSLAPVEFNPFGWASAKVIKAAPTLGRRDTDRIERALGLDGPGLATQIAGGFAVEYGVAMRCGDVVTSIARLGSYQERRGRLGLMLFTAIEDVWVNQDGEQIKRETVTGIRY